MQHCLRMLRTIVLCCVVATLFAQESSGEGEGSDSSSNIRREEVFQNIALGMYFLFSSIVSFEFTYIAEDVG